MQTIELDYAGLLRKVQKKDKTATNQICDLLRTELRRVLSWKIEDPGAIDDIIQETLIWFLDNYQKIEKAESVVAFVARKAFFLTKNYYIAKYSHRTRFVELEENHGSQEPDTSTDENEHNQYLHAKIVEQLQYLPKTYKEILTLHYIDGKSYSEISEQVGISYQNVKVRMFRGIKLLQKKVKKVVTLAVLLLTFY